MKKALTLLLIIGFTAIFTPYIPHAIAAEEHFLDPNTKIQDVIDDPNVLDGDSIILAPGIYHENIDFKGKAITLRSADPHDPNVVAATIIDGSQAGSVVYFDNGEDPNSVISGVTIRNGEGTFGGGISCSSSSPSIFNCLIISNLSYGYGGGIFAQSDLTLTESTVSDNSATGDGKEGVRE